MKKLLLTAGFALLAMGTYAQGITIGVTTGVNSTYVLDKGLREDPRYLAQNTYNWAPVGVSLGINVAPRFGFQLEAIKNTAGQVYEIVDIYKNSIGQREMVMNYLNLPFLLKFMDNELKHRANFNFMVGPQLSLLTSGYESISHSAGTMAIPEGGEAPANTEPNGDGTYNAEAQNTIVANKSGENGAYKLSDKDVQLVFNFGVRFKLSPKLSLNTDIRGNYGITDMRSNELVNSIKDGSASVDDIFSRRANLLVGLQLGLNYYIGL